MQRSSQLRRALPLAIGAALLLAACSAPVLGDLEATVSGLPADATATVDLSGPAGYAATLDAPGTLTALAPGEYTLTAQPVSLPNDGYVGTESFVAEPEVVQVVGDQTASVELAFAYAGARVEDVQGDAVGDPVEGPVYDLVSVTTTIAGEDLLIDVAVDPNEPDLSELIVIFDIDADQDVTTGSTSGAVNNFCVPAPDSLGLEYGIEHNPGGTELHDPGAPTNTVLPPPVIDGSTLRFTVPLSAIGGASRVNVGAVIGNFNVPTDCTQGTITTGP